MYYLCQLGQLFPRAQLVRYVPINYCQLGQLVPLAQLVRYELFMPIGPIGSTGRIGAVCPNELMPIGPIGSMGLIGATCTIYANWATWFHGSNWCNVPLNGCQLGQLVPSAQLARYEQFMPIGPIGSTVPIVAVCLNELMPIGPIGSTGPIGAICTNFPRAQLMRYVPMN